MSRLVIFDLDRTIVRFGTYTPFLLAYARRYAPWRLMLAPVAASAMLAYKLKAFSRNRLKEIMFALMAGSPAEATVEMAAERFADNIVAHGCFAEALRAIKAHQAAGDILVLATASFGLYAEPIARRLGIPHVVATGLDVRNGRYRPRLVGANCYGTQKRQMVLDALPAIGARKNGFLFYTDDKSDLPLLEAAAEGVLVNPKSKLRHWAQGQPAMSVVYWR